MGTDLATNDDESGNNLLAAGGLHMALLMSAGYGKALKGVTTVYDKDGNATNQVEVQFEFLQSPYRITIERVVDTELRPRCDECGTLADADGYCVDPGCSRVGKLVRP